MRASTLTTFREPPRFQPESIRKLDVDVEGTHVYDIAIEGVSLAVNYQSSYAEIMRKEGFDGLIAKMQAKINEKASN